MTSIEPILARAESTLARLQSETPDAPSLARSFGDDIYEIGRELTLHPESAAQVRAFVERTAPLVRLCTGLISWFHRVYRAAEEHSSETAEYSGALVLTSSLEFSATFTGTALLPIASRGSRPKRPTRVCANGLPISGSRTCRLGFPRRTCGGTRANQAASAPPVFPVTAP
jgi:hypothetical protein